MVNRRPLPPPAAASFGLALAALAGCTPPSDYPSLAPRPIEDASLAEPATPAPAPGTPAAAAAARFAPIVARARTADAAFRDRLRALRPTLVAGRDAATGSDAWGAAQQAASRLAALRGPIAATLLDLQQASQAEDVRDDAGLAAAAQAALDEVAALDAEEARALAAVTPR